MADAMAMRFLSDGSTDDALALKKQFDNIVREQFYDKNVLLDMMSPVVRSRDITTGKSFQFIDFADTQEVNYFRPGPEMLGEGYAFDEDTITIDDAIVKHHDVPEDHMEKVDWGVITPIAASMGRKIRERTDKILFIALAKAAREASKTKVVSGTTYTFHNGGNVVSRVGASGITDAYPATVTGAEQFRDDVAQLGQILSEDSAPTSPRYLFVGPYLMRVLRKDTTIFSRDFTRNPSNDLNKAIVGELEGFMVVETQHLPTANIGNYDLGGNLQGGALPSKYQGDFTYDGATGQPAALVAVGADAERAALGAVSRGGLRTHIGFDNRRLTTFMNARMYWGCGTLSPFCAGEIRVTAS